MVLYYIREYFNNDTTIDIKTISEEIQKYNKFYQDVSKSPVGKYSINQILETVKE